MLLRARQTELFSTETVARHTVCVYATLEFLDVQLAVAAFTIIVLIKSLWLLPKEVGYHAAYVSAHCVVLYLYCKPLGLIPAFGSVEYSPVCLLGLVRNVILVLHVPIDNSHSVLDRLICSHAKYKMDVSCLLAFVIYPFHKFLA